MTGGKRLLRLASAPGLVSSSDALLDFPQQRIASRPAAAEQAIRVGASGGTVQVQPEVGPLAETENRVEKPAALLSAEGHLHDSRRDRQWRERDVDEPIQEELQLKEEQIAEDHPTRHALSRSAFLELRDPVSIRHPIPEPFKTDIVSVIATMASRC